ncbi:MAG: ATP-binding protein [Actinomycetes bacterium]
MTRRLLASYVLLATFILLVVALPLGITYTRRAEDRLLADIERDARVMGTLVHEHVEQGDRDSVTSIVSGYSRQTGARVVVVGTDGISITDSARTNGPRRDFSTRPEFAAALGGTQASGIRRSGTLNDELAYAVVPITGGEATTGAVRVSFSTAQLQQQVRSYWLRLALLVAMVLGLAAGLGWLMSRWALAPVETLEAGAQQLAGGDLSGRISIARGPPELRALGDTFNLMATQLQRLVDSQRSFVADASHQLRTPLTAMRLRLEAVEDRVDQGDDSGTADDLDAVTAEIDRLSGLVEGLLALARADSGATAAVPVDVARLADDAVERWEPLASERGVTLERVGERRVEALTIPGAVEQVLDNLIDNAIDVAPVGSPISVDVTADHGQQRVVVDVRDHGPGLSEADRARATDRFWRGPAAAHAGTGLGLAIVQQLVEASGGTVTLRQPDDGEGLEVRIELIASSTS